MMRRQAVGGLRGEVSRITRKHGADHRIVLYVGLLVLIGLVVLFAVSPYQIHRINEGGGNVDQSHFMLKQLIYLGVGIAAFGAANMLSIDFWRRHAAKIVVVALLVSLALAVMGTAGARPAMCYNGACRWFDLGFTSFQPAEFLKFGLLVYVAVFLGKRAGEGRVNSVADTLLPIGVVMAIAGVFVVGLQKDMGTGLTMAGIVATMLIVAGLNRRNMLTVAAAAVGFGLLFTVLSPHRMERILTFTNAGGTTDAASYHIEMAKLAIGSGGLFGRGLGGGVQAFGYLPEALNDSIFAVLGEIFGFVGLVIIVGIFAVLLRRIIQMTDRLDDPMMKLLAAGGFGWLATHFVVNIGAMTGIFPLTGVTLPFLSFGGTSLLFMMAMLGILYRVSRYTSHDDRQERSEGDETSRSGRRLRRTRHTSTGRYQRA